MEGVSPAGSNVLSPSEMVGPSPVTSNGTDTTEIEDEITEDVLEGDLSPVTHAESTDSRSTVCSISSNANGKMPR
jgi:hypothetical protein